MSWNDVPDAPAGETWTADTTGGGGDGGDSWVPANDGDDGVFSNKTNISKHAGDGDDYAGDDAGPKDGGCRVCGQDSHFARDCPDKPEDFGKCFSCGEEGHRKADCPNPREAGPRRCRACQGEHATEECSENRVYLQLAGLGLDDLVSEDAWILLTAADKKKDIDDIKTAVLAYSKTCREMDLAELERAFRDAKMNTYLIAKQQEVAGTHTIVNLQGKPEQKYVVSFQFSAKPRRAKFAEGWPESVEDNMSRLEEAGFVMNSFVPKCIRCNEIGHIAKDCEQEKTEPTKLVFSCANCNMEGHRARDCTEPRKSGKKTCKVCESEDHVAKDCPDRKPDLCLNCGEEGHRKADCQNERVMRCHNCSGFGHASRRCPEPFDPMKLKCTNCNTTGHHYKRCPEPKKDAADGDEDAGDAGDGGNWDHGADAGVASADGGGDGGWETSTAAPEVAAGGGW